MDRPSRDAPVVDMKLFQPPTLKLIPIAERYGKASQRLIFINADSTLMSLIVGAQASVHKPRLIAVLKSLVENPRNVVWLISSLDRAFLTSHFGFVRRLGLNAENGGFIRYPKQFHRPIIARGLQQVDTQRQFDVELMEQQIGMSWDEQVVKVLKWLCERSACVFERSDMELILNYPKVCELWGHAGQRFFVRRCEALLVEKVGNDFVLEFDTVIASLVIRHRNITRGDVVTHLLKTRRQFNAAADPNSHFLNSIFSDDTDDDRDGTANHDAGFCLCLGESQGDEDMFHAVERSSLREDSKFTCSVGPGLSSTMARGQLMKQTDVTLLLEVLAEADQTG